MKEKIFKRGIDRYMIIAALASAPGKAGIAVIRASGANTFLLLQKFLKNARKQKISQPKFNYFRYGFFTTENGEIIDEVSFCFFKKNRSYTGEESAEIFCHGSDLIVTKILDVLYGTGKVREALAGEFTLKRFMNGKIDLTRSEAVIDLINAETDKAYLSAKDQLEGSIYKKLKSISQSLIDLISQLELEFDFSDEDLDKTSRETIIKEANEALSVFDQFIATFKTGKKYQDGIKVALCGQVNAGKSSLMNAFLNQNRVIVTDIEGTTRDIIEEKIEVSGYLLRIFDTAGMRDTLDLVEQEGIKRSLDIALKADVILEVVDATSKTEERQELFTNMAAKKIIVYNKSDLVSEEEREEEILDNTIYISCKTNFNIYALKQMIIKKVMNDDISYHSAQLTNSRHVKALTDARQYLEIAKENLDYGYPYEVIIPELKSALSALGEITGETTDLDILHNIFARFCIGK